MTPFFLSLSWASKQIKLRVILGVLFVSGVPIHAQQQMTAEWVKTRLGELGTSRTYVGRVAYKDSLGMMQIEADSAVVTGAQYVFVSNLLYQDSTRVIRANELRFDEKEHVAQFLGAVFLRDNRGTLSASEIHIWPDSQTLLAKKEVIFDLVSRSQRIKAQKLSFDGILDIGVGVGNVEARMVGAQGDTLGIQTDSLHFASKKEDFTFWGKSEILHSGMHLLATNGSYQQGLLQVFGSPEMNWLRAQPADSVWAKADTIEMRLKDQELRSFSLFSDTIIQLMGAQEGSVQTVRGNSAKITIMNKEISNLRVFGQAQLLFEKEGQSITLSGDSVSVWFTGGQLDSLVVEGQGDGKFLGKDEGVGHVSGNQKMLRFKANELVKMRIVGNAICRYEASGKKEGNQVDFNGDALILDFAQGALSHIDVAGNVQGVYLQNKTENVP